jgi:hypothetical protein
MLLTAAGQSQSPGQGRSAAPANVLLRWQHCHEQYAVEPTMINRRDASSRRKASTKPLIPSGMVKQSYMNDQPSSS